MNNFEYYKNKIYELDGDICTVNGELKLCMEVTCEDCDFNDDNCHCFPKVCEWLMSEHEEQPKLTKKERLFCELVETGWIARDKCEILYWHKDKPKKYGGYYWNSDSNMFDIEEMNEFCELKFPFITWEDTEPWAVEDLLKLDYEQ